MALHKFGQKTVPPPYSESPPPLPGSIDSNTPGVSTYQQHQPGPVAQAQPAWGYQPQPGYPPPQPQPMMYALPPPQQQQQQQQQQQVVVIGGAQQEHTVHIHHVETFFGQIVMSCIVFWCCNCLFGLIAFILAMVASSTVMSDPRGAHNFGVASYGVASAGIIVTIIIVVTVVAVVMSAVKSPSNTASLEFDKSGSPYCNYRINSRCYSYKTLYFSLSDCNSIRGYYSDGSCYYD